jgi:AraC-like DNA-binding protein
MVWGTTLSTDRVPPDRRVDFWNAAACSALVAQCADPLDRARFSGRMRCGDLGNIRVVELSSDAATIWHSKEHVARVPGEQYLLRIQRRGESVTSQDGREVRLRSGDFTLCDALRTYRLHFTSPATFLTLRIDRAALLRHLGDPQRIALVRVPGDSGLGLLASRLLCGIADAFDAVVDPVALPRLSSAVLDIVATAYTGYCRAPGRSRHASILRARILNYVESQLGDAMLSPTRVAGAFGLSRRYLHSLFESTDEPLGSYIWRRRLECARLVLLDPRYAGRTLTQIAEEHGFKTLAHFSRSFRQTFGAAPRDFRDQARTDKPRARRQLAGPWETNA